MCTNTTARPDHCPHVVDEPQYTEDVRYEPFLTPVTHSLPVLLKDLPYLQIRLTQ